MPCGHLGIDESIFGHFRGSTWARIISVVVPSVKLVPNFTGWWMASTWPVLWRPNVHPTHLHVRFGLEAVHWRLSSQPANAPQWRHCMRVSIQSVCRSASDLPGYRLFVFDLNPTFAGNIGLGDLTFKYNLDSFQILNYFVHWVDKKTKWGRIFFCTLVMCFDSLTLCFFK